MVFEFGSRDPLLPILNSGNTICFSDTVSRDVEKVGEEFYDTLLLLLTSSRVIRLPQPVGVRRIGS